MVKDVLATWSHAEVLDLILSPIHGDPASASVICCLLRVTLPYGQCLPIHVCDSQSPQAPVLCLWGSSETCRGSVEAEESGPVVHTGNKHLFFNILYSCFLFNRLVFI